MSDRFWLRFGTFAGAIANINNGITKWSYSMWRQVQLIQEIDDTYFQFLSDAWFRTDSIFGLSDEVVSNLGHFQGGNWILDIFSTRKPIGKGWSHHPYHWEQEKSLHFGFVRQVEIQIVISVNFCELIKLVRVILAPPSAKKLRDRLLRIRQILQHR